MLIGLPAFSFVFTVLFFRNTFGFLGWRGAYIIAAGTLAFLAVIFIELVSVFLCVTPFFVIGFWLVMTVSSLWLFWRSDAKRILKLCVIPELGVFDLGCIAVAGVILFVNAWIAFSFPPNTWDSMTYHLPRVMHWAADARVHFYPTSIDRQLFFLPGAEYLLLHCFLLTGDDRWFNFVQWISLVGCICSVSLIAKLLGASIRGQVLAALFVTTIPMAVLQSTSTQTDLFVSFWIVSFVALAMLVQRQFSLIVFLAASSAFGLSALAKGTFFIVIPFAVFFLISLWKKGARYLFVFFGIFLILVTGHYARSWAWQEGKILSSGQLDVMLKRHDPPSIAVNTFSQMASELMLPWDCVNKIIEKSAQRGTTFLGVDDRDQDMFGQVFARPVYPGLVFDEDYASNPVQVILIVLVLLFLWRMRPKGEVRLYCINVLATCFLFFFFVRWQPWINRLHLPLFILFSPLIGLVSGSWKKELTVLMTVALLGTAFSMIIFNQTRPLKGLNNPHHLPRQVYYFTKKPGLFSSYYYASRMIVSLGCYDVGLLQGADSWEYPLWALTGYGAVHFRSLDHDNFDGVLPCMVVTLDSSHGKTIVLGRQMYKLILQGPALQVFKKTF